jgi:di/tricarboxylate transporter
MDWAKAMLRELDFIESDWTALVWSIGSTRILLKYRNAPVAELRDVPQAAQRFQRRIFWRNLREYAAGVIVTAASGYYVLVSHSAVIRTGCGLIVAGALFVLFMLHKWGAARNLPSEIELRACVDFHRKELQRQRDLLRRVWSWYLSPFVPGLIVLLAGGLERKLERPNASAHTTAIVATFALAVAGYAAMFVGIGKLNQRAANKLQQEIDALDGLERES